MEEERWLQREMESEGSLLRDGEREGRREKMEEERRWREMEEERDGK